MASFQNRAKKQHLLRPDAAAELASLPATEIAAKWDKASKLQRCDILAAFVERFHACTAAEIERYFGSGAHLFFSRLTATMRLSYKTMAATCDRFGILLLMAVGLFLQGQRFLTSFAEIGGIQLLCDFIASIPNCNNNNAALATEQSATKSLNYPAVLSSGQQPHQQQPSIEAAAKTRGIRLLVHIANSGRVYREMVCEDGGLQHLVNATCFETDDSVLELLGSLFLSLGHGNPRRVRDVHAALLHLVRTSNDAAALCAASTLRALQVSRIGPSGVGGATEPAVGSSLLIPGASDGATADGVTSSSARVSASSAFVGSVSAAAATNRNSVGLVTEEVDFSAQGQNIQQQQTNHDGRLASSSPLRASHVSPIHLASAGAGGGGGGGLHQQQEAAEHEAGLVLYLDSLFHLLRSPSVRVRFEGIELLSLSAPGPGMLGAMIKRIVDILDDVDTTLHAVTSMSYERERTFLHLHASCVRLLFALLTHKDEAVAAETMKVFELRLLHLCLGRFVRVTQESHNKSMLAQSLRYSSASSPTAAAATQSLLRNTAAPTAAPGVQDAVRIFKVILASSTSAGAAQQQQYASNNNACDHPQLISANVLALGHADCVRKAVEQWLRKTLKQDDLFAPLLDPASSLHDPYILAIAQRLSDTNREQLEQENDHEQEQELKLLRLQRREGGGDQSPQQQQQQQQQEKEKEAAAEEKRRRDKKKHDYDEDDEDFGDTEEDDERAN